jgi:signal transduction histidine kinase/CheY-like chemotaxis protein
MHISKNIIRRVSRPLVHGLLAGVAILVIASCGLFYLWSSAREAQLDAVRNELGQLARVAATLVNGDLHKTLVSDAQAGSAEHLSLLAPLVRFHKATSDIIYVYTAVLAKNRVYYVLGTDYLYKAQPDSLPPDPIMAPHDTLDPSLRRALQNHEVAVNVEPVREQLRSYMSAYAPFFDSTGAFVGVVGVDMCLTDFDARVAVIRRSGTVAMVAVTMLSFLAGVVVFRLSHAAQVGRRRDRVIRARLAEAKKEAERQAQLALAASRAKGEFLANMSHEIRTPMNGVIGMTELLLETSLNPDQRDCAVTVRDSAAKLLTVINDILDFSKIEAGKLEIERIDMDLRATVLEVARLLAVQARQKAVEVTAYIDPSVPETVKGDSGRLRQVLFNLVSNAVKFTEKGEVSIDLRITDRDEHGMTVRCEVRDTGIGIATDRIGGLFRPFTQIDASMTRKFGGSGLGLSIVRQLVGLMGGETGVTSSEGGGSTFWFTARVEVSFPAAALGGAVRDSHSRTKDPMPNDCPPAHSAKRKYRILLAEDNAVNQKVARRTLEKLGYLVDVVADGRLAIQAWRAGHYDLILMDCQMPELDGYEATREIRALEAGRGHIPIIALTAHAMKGAAEQCTGAGMDAHLTKPIDRAQLQACLGRYLAGGISDGFAAPTAADDGDMAPVNRPASCGGVAT